MEIWLLSAVVDFDISLLGRTFFWHEFPRGWEVALHFLVVKKYCIYSAESSPAQGTREIGCLGVDLELRLIVLNCCNHFCVTLTRLCKIALLTTQALHQYTENTVGGDRALRIFARCLLAQRAN